MREAIFHKPWSPYAYLLDADTLSVTLKARKGDLKSCQLFHGDPWEPEKPPELCIAELKWVLNRLH